ncbi:MAG: putative bifunctional diguanylate cyclase/phosphodiesterase, partial [Acidimicrobiia bacterium]
LVSAVAAATAWQVRHVDVVQGPFHLNWLLMIPLVYFAELAVVHIQFRENAHSFSMSEVPLVVGLFFVDPAGLIAAQFIGNALAFGVGRRQSPVKASFNVAQFTLQAALGVIVFRAVLGDGNPLGSRGWLGVLVAMGLAVVVANVLINSAIRLSGGQISRADRLNVMKLGGAAATMNTSLGLVAVTVLWSQQGLAWAAAVPPIILYLAYRAHVTQREEHQRLQGLYEATKALHSSPQVEATMTAAVTHACTMFQARNAEIVIFPGGSRSAGLRAAAGPGGDIEEMHGIAVPGGDEVWMPTLRSGRSRLIEAGAAPRWGTAAGCLGMVAPVHGPEATIGVMVVTDPMGDVRRFSTRELRFLETLASQVSVSLENGRLEDSLAQLAKLKEGLKHRATHDTLTGVANRSLLQERVAEAAAESPPGDTAMLYLDLDDFKGVNDTLGHPAGDELLVGVAERIRSCCRPDDTIARMGGDEFAILLVGLNSPDDATRVADRIGEALNRPFLISGRQVSTHASIGAAFLGDGQDPAELIRHADQAMYAAKGRRKGTFRIFDDTIEKTIMRGAELRADLEAALEAGDLSLHYQPIVALDSGRIFALEALTRWNHPRHGPISPDEFIPLAEDSGLIVQLGRWVLDTACAQASRWPAHPDGSKPAVSINLSPQELAEGDIVADVTRALHRHRIDPDQLIVEITERAVAQPFTEVLADLKNLRVRIAVDDFGTGYSSLSYLDRLPIDIMKVDRSFVQPKENGESSPLVKTILQIGAALGLATIAEGIETPDQLVTLRKLGCNLGQGYLLGRPMQDDAADELLRAGKGQAMSPLDKTFPWDGLPHPAETPGRVTPQ